MVDVATLSVWVGLGVLVISVLWLFASHFQMRRLLKSLVKLARSIDKERKAGSDIEQQKLAQTEREQQYLETKDLFKAFGWLWEQLKEEDFEDEDY